MIKKKSKSSSGTFGNIQKASMALDDLVWALESVKLQSLREAAELLRIRASLSPEFVSAPHVRSQDPNKQFLIGVLPRLFQDKELFPQNEDIADFANAALRLDMSRTEKRSRYEIIGKVVCETDLLGEKRLTLLVTALEKLLGNKEQLAQMKEKKRTGSFSWNETIQDLLKV